MGGARRYMREWLLRYGTIRWGGRPDSLSAGSSAWPYLAAFTDQQRLQASILKT
jgi:hypothetical protein